MVATDVYEIKLSPWKVIEQIGNAIPGDVIPPVIYSQILGKLFGAPSVTTSYAHYAFSVERVMKEALEHVEPSWFNPRSVIPDFYDRILMQVRGEHDRNIAEIASQIHDPLIFIYYDPDTKTFHVWGQEPSETETVPFRFTMTDFAYTIKETIKYFTHINYNIALTGLAKRVVYRKGKYRRIQQSFVPYLMTIHS